MSYSIAGSARYIVEKVQVASCYIVVFDELRALHIVKEEMDKTIAIADKVT